MQYSKTFRPFLLDMTPERCLRTSFSWRCSNITTTKKLSQLNIFGEPKPRQIRKFQKLIFLKLETLSLTGLLSASFRTRSPRPLPQENFKKNFRTVLFPSLRPKTSVFSLIPQLPERIKVKLTLLFHLFLRFEPLMV